MRTVLQARPDCCDTSSGTAGLDVAGRAWQEVVRLVGLAVASREQGVAGLDRHVTTCIG